MENKMYYVKDGIIDATVWRSLSPGKHVLILLKEAYNSDGSNESWNLARYIKGQYCIEDGSEGKTCEDCKHLCKNGRISGHTYNRVAEWVMAVAEDCGEYDGWLGKSPGEYTARRQELLMKAAIVNVKKMNGTPSSSMKELCVTANSNKLQLREQINEVSPDVIICGGTKALLDIIYAGHEEELDGKKVIALCHPNARNASAAKMYDSICTQL